MRELMKRRSFYKTQKQCENTVVTLRRNNFLIWKVLINSGWGKYVHVAAARWRLKSSVEFATFLGECRVLLAALFQMVDTIRHPFRYLQCLFA